MHKSAKDWWRFSLTTLPMRQFFLSMALITGLVTLQITCNIKDENKENHTYNGKKTYNSICSMKDVSIRLQYEIELSRSLKYK